MYGDLVIQKGCLLCYTKKSAGIVWNRIFSQDFDEIINLAILHKGLHAVLDKMMRLVQFE
jgi:hypothetical protein